MIPTIRSRALQNRRRKAALLCKKGGQKMLYVHLLITASQSLALRRLQRFLSFLG